ncbi:hypothetical protein AHAS_Ahas11G0066300 [Arachis hypogaea]
MGSRKKKKWVAPKCNCGTHAILFMSGTELNPARLFFGCLYFKISAVHCKFFAWFDEYVSSFNEDTIKSLDFGGLKQNQVQLKGTFHVVHDKVKEFGKRLTGLKVQFEKSKENLRQSMYSSVGYIVMAFIAGVVISKLLRVFG